MMRYGEASLKKVSNGLFMLSWIVLFMFLTLDAGLARNRNAARTTFQQASKLEKELRSLPPNERTFNRYRNVFDMYRKVLDLDATFGGCDDALYRAAVLCREASGRIKGAKYYQRAVYYLKWLRKEYPYSPLRDDALLLQGDILAENLGDKKAAKKAYEEFIRKYSKSKKVSEAVRKLNELDNPPKMSRSEKKVAVKKRPSNNSTKSTAPAPSVHQRPLTATLLTNIRYWSTSDYTRVVMDLDNEVTFQQKEVGQPYRIYFDFEHTKLSQDVKDRDFSIGDTYLYRIRVGQNRQDVARVVLDFKKKGSFTIFSLYNPFRVVIDIKDLEKGKTLKARQEKLAKFFRSEKAKQTKKRSDQASKDAQKTARSDAETQPGTASHKGESSVSTTSAEDRSQPIKPSGPTASGEHTLPRILGMKVGKIVIDPGHGGKDSGSIGYKGMREKTLTLSIAKQLKKEIESRLNVEVILTRDRDVFMPLEQRTALANVKGADLFISLHANASRNNRIAGIETFYLGLTRDKRSQLLASIENAASQQSLAKLESSIKKITRFEKMNESREFALKVHKEFYKTIKKLHPATRDRGVKKAPFVVLIGADIPSILLEIGFISNKREAQIISSKKNQKKIAIAICRGIETYLSNLGTIARSPLPSLEKQEKEHGR